MTRQTLILLPGLLCDERLWAHPMKALADIAHVECADLTQHGSFSAMAKAILARAPQHFAVVGLSMGGLVAFELMRQAPERITHLALLNTNHRAFTQEQIANYEMFIQLARRGHFERITDTYLLPVLTHHRTDLTPVIHAMANAIGKEAFIRQAEATIGRIDSTETLRRVQCPTLFMTGQHDHLCDVDLHRQMAAFVPNSTLEIIPNCGHLSALEQPEAVSGALRRWLGETRAERFERVFSENRV